MDPFIESHIQFCQSYPRTDLDTTASQHDFYFPVSPCLRLFWLPKHDLGNLQCKIYIRLTSLTAYLRSTAPFPTDEGPPDDEPSE